LVLLRKQNVAMVIQVSEAPAVLLARSADKADRSPVLVGHNPPAVVLLLIDPAVAVERAGHFVRVHERNGR